MNADELKTVVQRKLILKTIRDDFNGSVQNQNAIVLAISGWKTKRGVISNLNWLVAHGELFLEIKDARTKSYTLTETAT